MRQRHPMVQLQPQSVLRAALLMLLATLLLSGMHALVRHVSQSLHTFEVAFFRNLFGLVAVLPLLAKAGPAGLKTAQPMLQTFRALSGTVAMLGWFYGLSVVPIAEATALSFTAALFGTLAAVVLLGERLRLRRSIAIAAGFLGALIILRPGVLPVSFGALMILLSSLCWGINVAVVKRLSTTDSSVSIVAWMAISLSLISFWPALWVWRWPTPVELFWLMCIGALGTGGHFAMIGALRASDASAVLPLDFTRLIWTSLIGFWAFAELPDLWTYIGGTVIFTSTAFITYREAQLRRAAQHTALDRKT